MKSSKVCYVCGSRGASCVLHVRPQESGVSYFSFLESHVPPRGAVKPDCNGAVSACTVCSAFLNQQWDTFERTRTPLVKRLYWLKRIDNGAFTGAEMSVQGEYVAQLMGLHGGINASSGGGSPFEYGNHAGISCGKPDLIRSDDEESIASDCTNGALDLSISPRKPERLPRKRGLTKASIGHGTKKRNSNGVVSNVICYICQTICHHSLARFIYAFKSSSDEPHFPFLFDLSPPAGAMPLTKTGVTQVCAECRKTLTRQWRSHESRSVPETDRVYWINDVAYPKKHESLQQNLACDRKQKSATCISTNICYLCGQPDGATHWIATRTGCETEMVLPFVAQLKCPTGARPIGVDGRTRICAACFVHMKKQWQKFDADSIPQEKRTFVLRPVAKTSSSISATADNDIDSKKKILADCPLLATVLSADTQANSEIQDLPQQPIASRTLQTIFADDSLDVKPVVAAELSNGTCTLTNGTLASTCCRVCGLDCQDVVIVGKQQSGGIHMLLVTPVDASNDSSQRQTEGSSSLPFFPFLAHLPLLSLLKASSLHENSVQSCAVCYVNLIRQWQRFEMTSSDDVEEQRLQRQYTYQMINCDMCHVNTERDRMTVVSKEAVNGLLQSVDSSVDGLNLVCQLCCISLLSADKSLMDSEHFKQSAVMSADVETGNNAVTVTTTLDNSHQHVLSSPAKSQLENQSIASDSSNCHLVEAKSESVLSVVQQDVADTGKQTEVSELCTEDGLSDAALLDNSNRNVSGGSQSREQTHVSCSKSPSTTTVSVSAPAQASFVISRPTVTAIGDVHMTARNLLPHMFSTRTSTVPGTMAASLGDDSAAASATLMQAHLLQQQQASVLAAALSSPGYFGLSPLFSSFLPSSPLLAGFPSSSSLLGHSTVPLSSSLSVLTAENKCHRNTEEDSSMLDKHNLAKQKDDDLLLKQEEVSRPQIVLDGEDSQLHRKAGNSSTNSCAAFHRPFLNVDDNSPPAEKLRRLSGSEPPNGICAAPVQACLFSTTAQRLPVCSSNLTSASSPVEEAGDCQSGELDKSRRCEGDGDGEVRDEDGGRLNAALGLISLADVNSDLATYSQQSTSCAEPTPENHRQCIELAESDVSAVESRDASRAPASGSCEPALQSLHRRKFVWPGIEAVIEAYASHAEELELERECLHEQRQQLEQQQQQLTATAQSLTSELQSAETVRIGLAQELFQLRTAIDDLKNCLRHF